MYPFPYSLHGLSEDYLSCDIAYNAVMPLSRASTRGRYSRIVAVTVGRGPHSLWAPRDSTDLFLLPIYSQISLKKLGSRGYLGIVPMVL